MSAHASATRDGEPRGAMSTDAMMMKEPADKGDPNTTLGGRTMSDPSSPDRPVIRSNAELAAWSRIVAAAIGAECSYGLAVDLADRAIVELRIRIELEDLAGLADAPDRSDPFAGWPPCSVCGLGIREGDHVPADTASHIYTRGAISTRPEAKGTP